MLWGGMEDNWKRTEERNNLRWHENNGWNDDRMKNEKRNLEESYLVMTGINVEWMTEWKGSIITNMSLTPLLLV